MSEPLITKENYLEIGKVECNECKAVLDWNTVDEAIRKYGLIALHKESTGLGYFGYTCPHCIKTSLHETNLDFLRFLVSGNLIISETIGLESESYLNFGYYSNLTYYFTVFSCDLFDIKNPKIEIIGDRFRGDDPWFKRGYSSIYNQNHRFLNHYSSFLPDSIYIDPRLIIQFFDTESDPIFDSVFKIDSFLPIQIIRSEYDIIESCREFENQTGEKIFNRYVLLHDSIYQEMNQRWIDHYCSAKFHLSRLVLPRSRENESAKSAINRVRSILNSDPRLRNMKSANFLNTLCLNNLSSYEKDGEQHYSNFYTNEFEVDFIELKKIYFEIWDNFHDSNLQKLLVAMADNFRADYFKQIRRVDCSYKKIWILRQQYLYNIYDSMKSPQHMRRIQQGVAEKYLKKINILEEPHPNLKKIKTQSFDMVQIKESIINICRSKVIDRFLLFGETGTGKELFAKAIHELCGRSGAFIPVNCASIPENMFEGEFFGHVKGAFTGATSDKSGFFEQADSGTIFLDEIGELDPKFQARFLRVLQEKEFTPIGGKLKKVDFILISATNRDLEKMVEDGTFREDLYQRISDYTIPIPPLSERKEDISLLTQHFIEKYDMALRDNESLEPLIIENDALNKLEEHTWRGNIRELEKVCKLVLAFRDQDDRSDIKETEFNLTTAQDPQASKSQRLSKRQKPLKKKKAGPGNTKVTSDEVKQALKNNNGNRTKAAEELGVTYHTILRHCKKLGI